MKNNYQEIIDKFGEVIDCQMHYGCNHSSHITDVRIGDVLTKIYSHPNWYSGDLLEIRNSILRTWALVGFTKPLSEILRDEKGHYLRGKFFYSECTGEEHSPKATELFQLLKKL